MGKEDEIEKLQDTAQYKRWRLWLFHYLKSKGLSDYVENDMIAPLEDNAKQEFQKKESRVFALTYKRIDVKFTDLIADLESPKAMINALDSNFRNNKFEQLEEVTRKLEMIKFTPDSTRL